MVTDLAQIFKAITDSAAEEYLTTNVSDPARYAEGAFDVALSSNEERKLKDALQQYVSAVEDGTMTGDYYNSLVSGVKS